MDNKPITAISVERTVQIGRYEPVKVFLSISNITEETTTEEIRALIEKDESIFDIISKSIEKKIGELKAQ